MKKYLLPFLLFLIPYCGFTQSKQELVFTINSALDNKSEVFTLQDRSGYLMQNQPDGLYRLHLADIESILTKANQQNGMVEITCRDHACFAITKGDSSSYSMGSFAYLFSSTERANRFAQALHKLCAYFQGDPNPVTLQLIKGEKTLVEPIPSSTPPPQAKQKDAIDEAMDEDEKTGTNKTSAKKVKKDEDTDADDDEKPVGKKLISKDEDEEEKPAKNIPSSRQRPQKEDHGLVNEESEREVKKESILSKQLMQVVQSGMSSNFKSIEGPETNPKTHINDSKIKLKGAKRNYLSWHKNQRAFIAEMKSTKSLEDIQFDYDDLQTEIENGLGPEWDNEDKSNDEEYADFSGEVRDTEYKSSNPGVPTIRIIMLSDGEDKFTLFIRVK